MNLTSFQRPELRDANNNVTQSGTYSVKNGVLTNAQNSGVLDYINNNLQAHQNVIETLQTGALQTKIVTSLPNPSVADANTIYMIKYTSGSDEYYYQYRFIDGSFVRVGDTKIDITDLTAKVNTNTTNIATLSNGKVAKVGDKISGSLGFAGSSMDIYKDGTSSSLYIGNGFAWNKGASINLFGKEHTSSAGVVRIDAHNGTNYSRIELTPSGSLKLNNNTVLTTSNGVAKTGDTMSGTLSVSSGGSTVDVSAGRIEISHTTPYIDFHFNKSSNDYTTRIVESSEGNLCIASPNRTSNTQAPIECISASGTNYIRYASGIQICWGFETNTTDLSFTVTFPVAFSVKPSVNATYSGADASKNAVVNNVSVSNFVIIKTLANSWVCWQAIGKWK